MFAAKVEGEILTQDMLAKFDVADSDIEVATSLGGQYVLEEDETLLESLIRVSEIFSFNTDSSIRYSDVSVLEESLTAGYVEQLGEGVSASIINTEEYIFER